ncbi:hypothetical protein GGQ80_002034 [Sphingomonas jinjuensis]|uniref:Uncharacterized protein n=1 Tax=Sphingomonas jinjuensis TaxID=535907 RepID=A0A840FEG9_9SPHN|nr:hypothetical protein [Sphingomonas jinjuensis]MBB4154124.1 hypothetical protein [Sphingomonas jinjuensis]
MDRIEIPMEGEIARWVEAAERGDEVVFVQNEQVRASLTLAPEASQRLGHSAIATSRALEI